MKANPYINNKELAEVCGITEDGVYWNTKKLTRPAVTADCIVITVKPIRCW